jgi:UPF0755 protein
MLVDTNDQTFELNEKIAPKKHNRFCLILLSFLAVSITTLLYYSWVTKAPVSFPLETDFVVEEGTNIKIVAKRLHEMGYIRSELALYLAFLWKYDPGTIKASTFRFSEPLDVFELAHELTIGHFNTDLIKVTHIEGESISDLAKRLELAGKLQNFDSEVFYQLAIEHEGKLYPETYFVPKTIKESDLLTLMLETYKERTEIISDEIINSELSELEILTLASIIEREANDPISMGMVSGILQNRLSLGMPLQADASLEYILDKPLAELMAEDLKIDSPYNTYLNKGLPPTPIGNPGMEAIKSVLNPIDSDYLFYITGDDGYFYYAKNFDQHRMNIVRYLR